MSDFIVPLIVCFVILFGVLKRRDVFSDFVKGAKSGLDTSMEILPSLVCLMLIVGMLKASGLIDALTNIVSSVTGKIGFPKECVPLALIRPFSGSGALSVFENIIRENGPDSFVGKVASVLMGSTETTFYTIAVYFSCTKIKKTSYCTASALIGDITGFIMSVIAVKILL